MMTSMAKSIFTVSIVFSFLAILAVAFRFWARKRKGLNLGADDYVMAMALVVALGTATMLAYGSYIGATGYPIDTQTPENYVIGQKLTFSHEQLFTMGIGVVKISIVLFYKRIFTTGNFPRTANIVVGLVFVWMLLFLLLYLLYASPLSWFFGHTGHVNRGRQRIVLAQAIMDVILDFFILCLPLPMIKRLHMNVRRKIILTGLFWLGAFCVVASGIRLYYVSNYNRISDKTRIDDIIVEFSGILLWSVIEQCASIIAGCLPALGPLFKDGYLSSFSRRLTTNKKGNTLEDIELGRSEEASNLIKKPGLVHLLLTSKSTSLDIQA